MSDRDFYQRMAQYDHPAPAGIASREQLVGAEVLKDLRNKGVSEQQIAEAIAGDASIICGWRTGNPQAGYRWQVNLRRGRFGEGRETVEFSTCNTPEEPQTDTGQTMLAEGHRESSVPAAQAVLQEVLGELIAETHEVDFPNEMLIVTLKETVDLREAFKLQDVAYSRLQAAGWGLSMTEARRWVVRPTGQISHRPVQQQQEQTIALGLTNHQSIGCVTPSGIVPPVNDLRRVFGDDAQAVHGELSQVKPDEDSGQPVECLAQCADRLKTEVGHVPAEGGGISFLMIGDCYDSTLIFDHQQDKYVVGAWGETVEQQSVRFPQAVDQDGDVKPDAVLPRQLREVAKAIRADWKNPKAAALPYLEALEGLGQIDESYGQETGREVVRGFLANAQGWRGAVARGVKSELRAMLSGKPLDESTARKRAAKTYGTKEYPLSYYEPQGTATALAAMNTDKARGNAPGGDKPKEMPNPLPPPAWDPVQGRKALKEGFKLNDEQAEAVAQMLEGGFSMEEVLESDVLSEELVAHMRRLWDEAFVGGLKGGELPGYVPASTGQPHHQTPDDSGKLPAGAKGLPGEGGGDTKPLPGHETATTSRPHAGGDVDKGKPLASGGEQLPKADGGLEGGKLPGQTDASTARPHAAENVDKGKPLAADAKGLPKADGGLEGGKLPGQTDASTAQPHTCTAQPEGGAVDAEGKPLAAAKGLQGGELPGHETATTDRPHAAPAAASKAIPATASTCCADSSLDTKAKRLAGQTGVDGAQLPGHKMCCSLKENTVIAVQRAGKAPAYIAVRDQQPAELTFEAAAEMVRSGASFEQVAEDKLSELFFFPPQAAAAGKNGGACDNGTCKLPAGITVKRITKVKDAMSAAKGTKWDFAKAELAQKNLANGPLLVAYDGDKPVAAVNPKTKEAFDAEDRPLSKADAQRIAQLAESTAMKRRARDYDHETVPPGYFAAQNTATELEADKRAEGNASKAKMPNPLPAAEYGGGFKSLREAVVPGASTKSGKASFKFSGTLQLKVTVGPIKETLQLTDSEAQVVETLLDKGFSLEEIAEAQLDEDLKSKIRKGLAAVAIGTQLLGGAPAAQAGALRSYTSAPAAVAAPKPHSVAGAGETQFKKVAPVADWAAKKEIARDIAMKVQFNDRNDIDDVKVAFESADAGANGIWTVKYQVSGTIMATSPEEAEKAVTEAFAEATRDVGQKYLGGKVEYIGMHLKLESQPVKPAPATDSGQTTGTQQPAAQPTAAP